MLRVFFYKIYKSFYKNTFNDNYSNDKHKRISKWLQHAQCLAAGTVYTSKEVIVDWTGRVESICSIIYNDQSMHICTTEHDKLDYNSHLYYPHLHIIYTVKCIDYRV